MLVGFGPFRSMIDSFPSFSLVEQSTTVWLMARRHEPPWAAVLVSTSAVRSDTASMRHGALWPLTIICPMAILQSGPIALATRVSTIWVPSSDTRSEALFRICCQSNLGPAWPWRQPSTRKRMVYSRDRFTRQKRTSVILFDDFASAKRRRNGDTDRLRRLKLITSS